MAADPLHAAFERFLDDRDERALLDAVHQYSGCAPSMDAEIVDASRAAAGVLTVRTRTWNVLYAINGLQPRPPCGDVREVAIAELLKWSCEPWGGPVPRIDRPRRMNAPTDRPRVGRFCQGESQSARARPLNAGSLSRP